MLMLNTLYTIDNRSAWSPLHLGIRFHTPSCVYSHYFYRVRSEREKINGPFASCHCSGYTFTLQ